MGAAAPCQEGEPGDQEHWRARRSPRHCCHLRIPSGGVKDIPIHKLSYFEIIIFWVAIVNGIAALRLDPLGDELVSDNICQTLGTW